MYVIVESLPQALKILPNFDLLFKSLLTSVVIIASDSTLRAIKK